MKAFVSLIAMAVLLACLFSFSPSTVYGHHFHSPAAGSAIYSPGLQFRVNAIGFNVYSPGNALLAGALNYQAANRAQAIAAAQAAAQYRYQANLQAAARAQAAYSVSPPIGLAPSYTYGSFSPLYAAVPRQPFVQLNVPAYGNCGVPAIPAGGQGGCPPGASSLFYR